MSHIRDKERFVATFKRVASDVVRIQPEGEPLHDVEFSVETHIGTCEFCGREMMVQTTKLTRKDNRFLTMSCTKCVDCAQIVEGVMGSLPGGRA